MTDATDATGAARRRKGEHTAESLLQCFHPPAGHTGLFGVLCGYSADASFLDAAAHRFALQTAAQRSYAGRTLLLALLDPGQAQIRPEDAPGVLHVPLRDKNRPFALLHAKVALLGFQSLDDPGAWCLRLLVSTGNWTRQTVEESLDLAWSIDLRSAELDLATEPYRQARADVAAARDFLEWLTSLFDIGALASQPLGLSAEGRARFGAWCRAVRSPRGVIPRFFHNRRQSLLAQLPDLVRAHAGDVRRNSLVLGSGFYEAPLEEGQLPKALEATVAKLRDRGGSGPLLSEGSFVDVFVEPTACQAVASAATRMSQEGWNVRPAAQPAFLGTQPRRRLHAKFIFSANTSTRSSACSSAWLYLGSGNLTHPGFVWAMAPGRGNLEAGVVFGCEGLHWHDAPRMPPDTALTNRLPVQWDRTFANLQEPLAAGTGMPERPDAYIAPPVAWCRHEQAADGTAQIELPAHDVPLQVLDPHGQECRPLGARTFSWNAAPPRSVQVRWRDGLAAVPVVDASGRVGGGVLPALDIEAAWWQLSQFPLPPPDDEVEDGEKGEELSKRGGARAQNVETQSAVRVMMRLVENIADRQSVLHLAEWRSWCASLRQTLMQACGTAAIDAFVELGLNPLTPLRAAPFRPPFAADDTTEAGQLYLEALAEVEQAWGVANLHPIAVHGEGAV